MSIEDRERWDARHRRATRLSPEASVLRLPAATRDGALALDLACGQGRHALALRELGYLVVAMDASREALRRLCEASHREYADEPHHPVPVQADADDWPFADEAFDAIVQVDFLDRRLFAPLEASLKPGGWLLIDTFLDSGRPNAGGPSRAAFRLTPGELPRVFRHLRIVRYEELVAPVARASMLAQRR